MNEHEKTDKKSITVRCSRCDAPLLRFEAGEAIDEVDLWCKCGKHFEAKNLNSDITGN